MNNYPDISTESSSDSPNPKPTKPARHQSDQPRTISWVTERDVLRKFGDRRTRAILAILTARRSAGCLEFFVPPHIAGLFRLSPKDLCWALKALEGKLVNTVGSTKGKFRKVRLLPAWEDRVEAERDRVPTKASPVVGGDDDAETSSTNDPVIAATLREISLQQSCGHTQPPDN